MPFVKLAAIAVKGAKAGKKLITSSKILRNSVRIGRTATEIYGAYRMMETAGNILGGGWGGSDYEEYAEEHRMLCNELKQIQECMEGCSRYLKEASETWDEAQRYSKERAKGLKDTRVR